MGDFSSFLPLLHVPFLKNYKFCLVAFPAALYQVLLTVTKPKVQMEKQQRNLKSDMWSGIERVSPRGKS